MADLINNPEEIEELNIHQVKDLLVPLLLKFSDLLHGGEYEGEWDEDDLYDIMLSTDNLLSEVE